MNSGPHDTLGSRRAALEESFFPEGTAPPLECPPQQPATLEQKRLLAESSGIRDDDVLDHLLAANIRGETITAISLVPLVVVAWSDGSLDEAERRSILAACEAEGITPHSVGYQLLECWLKTDPGPVLLQAWKEFLEAARSHLSVPAWSALRADLMGRARNVALASGSPPQAGNISAAEERMLLELDQAFEPPA